MVLSQNDYERFNLCGVIPLNTAWRWWEGICIEIDALCLRDRWAMSTLCLNFISWMMMEKMRWDFFSFVQQLLSFSISCIYSIVYKKNSTINIKKNLKNSTNWIHHNFLFWNFMPFTKTIFNKKAPTKENVCIFCKRKWARRGKKMFVFIFQCSTPLYSSRLFSKKKIVIYHQVNFFYYGNNRSFCLHLAWEGKRRRRNKEIEKREKIEVNITKWYNSTRSDRISFQASQLISIFTLFPIHKHIHPTTIFLI